MDEHQQSHGSQHGDAPRRRSTRDIKRTKFDDEIVESSMKATPNKLLNKLGRLDTSNTSTVGAESASPSSVKDRSPLGSTYSPGLLLNAQSTTPSMTESPLASPVISTSSLLMSSALPPLRSTSSTVAAKRGRPEGKKVAPPPPTTASPALLSNKTSLSRGTSTSTPSSSSGKMNHQSNSNATQLCGVARAGAVEDMGRWTSHDDVLLVTSVMQSNDLRKVHSSTRFSQRFTLEQISYRWYALLYDPTISKLAMDAMRALPRETIRDLQSRVPFTKREEAVLANVASTPSVADFEQLIQTSGVFLEARTARSLLVHWQHMKHYRLLTEQKGTNWTQLAPNDTSFAEIEDSLDVEPDPTVVDMVTESETYLAQRRLHREIRMIDNELPKWNVLTEAVVGNCPPEFDSMTVAILRGRLVRYVMRTNEVVLGRANKRCNVDVDLSLEGPAWKLSRRQATIKTRPSGEFSVNNDGRTTMFIDGQPLLTGQRCALENNAVLEIGHVRLVFSINPDTQARIRNDAARLLNA